MPLKPEFNNTAGRIHAIFAEFRRRATTNILNAWGEVFGMQVVELDALYRKLHALSQGLDRVEQQLKESSLANRKHYLDAVQELRGAICQPHLHAEASNVVRKHLNDSAMAHLKLAANELPKDGEVSDQEINDLRTQVNELFPTIADEITDPQVRTWILDILNCVRQSLDDYYFHGADVLDRGMSYVVGAIARHRGELEKRKEKPWFQQFGKVVGWFFTVASKANQTRKGIEETRETFDAVTGLLTGS